MLYPVEYPEGEVGAKAAEAGWEQGWHGVLWLVPLPLLWPQLQMLGACHLVPGEHLDGQSQRQEGCRGQQVGFTLAEGLQRAVWH